MAHTNAFSVSPQVYEHLLEQFPAEMQEQLRLYTVEELFYAQQLLLFKPVIDKNGQISGRDLFHATIKAKLIRWLKGQEKTPVAALAWAKIGARWHRAFEAFLIECGEDVEQEVVNG